MRKHWFGWKGLRCVNTDGPARLVYLSRRWQVSRVPRAQLHVWRVDGFGFGVRLGWIDIVRLP